MQHIKCNLCDSKDYKIIASSKDFIHKTSNLTFQIVECISCGLSYTNPRPSIIEIEKYYSPNYSFFKDDNKFKNLYREILILLSKSSFICFFLNFIPFIRKRIIINLHTKKIKYPLKLNSNDFFLDIGSGSGVGNTHWWGKKESIKTYNKLTKNIFAVEPDKGSHKILKNYVAKSFYAIDDIDVNILFDKIRLNWSLEHVHDPQKYFKFISERLKKDGEALICIPNFGGHIYEIDPSISELPIHLYHFKIKNIEDYCNKNNLKITLFKTFSYSTMYYFSSLIFKNDYLSQFKNMSINQLRNFQKTLDQLDKENKGNDMVLKITHN